MSFRFPGLRAVLLAAIALSFIFAPLAQAQQPQLAAPGSVAGVVTDQAGGTIAEARLSLLGLQRALIAATVTGAQGEFSFPNVPAGTYELMVESEGFGTLRLPVAVRRGQPTEVRAVLDVRAVMDTVTVTAETGQIQDIDRIPQQVNIVSETEIAQRATRVLAEVATEESGLAMQRTSPTVGSVLVRGLTEVGVYVDGVRYTTATQRGGINTFFNLNEPTALRAVEVLRGPNSAQYGSDSLGGTVQLVSRGPVFGTDEPQLNGELNSFFSSADLAFGSNASLNYGTRRLGIYGNAVARRVNTLRPGGGIDSHAAVTRFLGIPSDVFGTRLTDTAFTQYGGTLHLSYAPTDQQQFSARYQRSQQDGGKRYDQTLGGDGNLIADLRNLMLDFFYARYMRQGFGVFDNLSATVSYNSQREERVNQGGQGNWLATIISDRERTTAVGANFFVDKHLPGGHTLLIGADLYRDTVDAASFSVNPATSAVSIVRPRVPDGARYLSSGIYIQDAFDAVPGRLRLSGALRYNVASYRSRAANSPLVGGQPLWPDDSLRVGDFSGRFGAVGTLAEGVNLAFNFSRGFRAPNITSLGSLGLVGVGYQVAVSDLAGLDAAIGTTADDRAVSTGIAVQPLRSETSNNYEVSFRVRRGRLDTDLTGFVIDLNDAITRQTLILPPGAVGQFLGSQQIERQLPSGAVFVPLSASPVLVQANFGATRLTGLEYTLDLRLTRAWTFGGNFSYVRAADRATGEPPNLGGAGIPPAQGLARLRYAPAGSPFWLEAYTNLHYRQERLSSLDLADRRTGATRSRTNIANFFNRGARARGLIGPGPDGRFGTADDVLLPTGETLAQVQNRVLGSATSAPLFTAIPGYGLINLRGGWRFNEQMALTFAFENIADKSHRAPGWGIDGPGRGLTLRFQRSF